MDARAAEIVINFQDFTNPKPNKVMWNQRTH